MEDLSSLLFTFLSDVLTQLPSLLTMLICVIIAIIRWKRHPKASLLVLLGLIFMILQALVFAAVYAWVPRWIATSETINSSRAIYMALGATYNSFFAISMGALLLAIFIGRKPQRA